MLSNYIHKNTLYPTQENERWTRVGNKLYLTFSVKFPHHTCFIVILSLLCMSLLRVIHHTVSNGMSYHLSAPPIWLNDFFRGTSRWQCYFYTITAVAFEWRRCGKGYFGSFTHQVRPYKPNYLCCVCAFESKREGGRSFFDPSESEEGIELLVPLNEMTIPRSGVQFHLCHVEIPSSGMVCLSFKDAVLIRSRLPDVSAYRWIHVSRSLILRLSVSSRSVEGQWVWVFVVRLSDTQIPPTRKLHLCQGDLSS